jgi:3-methyl-2-oxobutanoate hydroxymethyltransferase
MGNKQRPITVPQFVEKKTRGEKISMLTAYDFPTATLIDQAGVDSILVGDSLSMVVQGNDTTLPVTLDEMIYHGRIVCRAVKHALTIVDLPFPWVNLGKHDAIMAASRILKETGCQAVKLETSRGQAEIISALVDAGIPVMAHVGLRPQAIRTMGTYKVQRELESLMLDAKSAEQAGAFGVVVECVPSNVARELTAAIGIPTIGIGAGPHCDGQVLVIHDLLGLTTGYVPSFAKQYAQIGNTIQTAVKTWCEEIRSGAFPDQEHSFN